MYFSFLLSSLLAFSTVHAGAIKRNISPAPSDEPTGTVDPVAQASAYNAGLTLNGSPPDSGDVTTDSIRLVNFDGCANMPGVSDAEAQIYSGWQQAQKVMAVQAIKDGAVDFNSAGAVDYLGAPGINSPRQGDMNGIFRNFATLTPAYWPFGWRIHVRCDDPSNICPCSNAFAYTTNKDPQSGLARINFCRRYFGYRTLDSAINGSRNLPADQKYNMLRYHATQARAFIHELMHIDWVTGAYGPNGRYGNNQHVTDLKIQFTDHLGDIETTKAYGPTRAKILARWPINTGDYTIRNADNLALFLISQYVQQQLGAYPHLPLVDVDQPDGPPSVYNTLFQFNSNGSVSLNNSNPLSALFTDGTDDASGCTSDEDEPDPDPILFSSFAPDSAYPSDYVVSLSYWIASETEAPEVVSESLSLIPLPSSSPGSSPSSSSSSLPDSSSASSPSPTPSPTPSPSGSPYCIPFQDPDRGINGYCQCTDGADFSFASGDNPCPYTSPGPASASINASTVTGSGGILDPPPTPTPTPNPAPAPSPTDPIPPADASPVIGNSCTPDNPEWGCSQDNSDILYCYCGDGNCAWTSFGQCDDGATTCHLSSNGNCGLLFGACC